MPLLNTASAIYLGDQEVDRVYAGSELVWPPPPAAGFSPDELSGLAVWFDASKLNLSDGAAINSWPNLGSGPTGTIVGSPSPVARTNALQGRRVARFRPSEGRLRIPSNSGVHLDWTLVYVGRLVGPTPGRVVNATYPPNNLVVGFWNGNEDVLYDNGFAGNTYKPWTTDWKLYSGDGSDSPRETRLFSDGALLGSTPTSAGWGGTFNISGYAATEETCDCEVAEVVQYDRKLSDTERQQVEDYLREKWITPLPVPKQIYGLEWWLDASKLALADGASVTTWPDLSGKGHDAVAVEIPPKLRKDVTSLGAVEFVPGASQRLNVSRLGTFLTGRRAYSMFIMIRPVNGFGNYPVILTAPTNDLWQWIVEFDASAGLYWGASNGSFRMFHANTPLNTWSSFSFIQGDGQPQRLWRDEVEITSYSLGPGGDSAPAAPNLWTDVWLGAYYQGSYGVEGQIAEIILYDRALNNSERQQIEAYLRNKWL